MRHETTSVETTIFTDPKVKVRQSAAGRSLTSSQFDEAWALSGIVAREIDKSGSFRDKLSDYAHAFARTERFDALKGEEIIRAVYEARYGQTMNQTREGLMSREADLQPSVGEEALRHARSVVERIREAPTMPFYQAYDRAAVAFADERDITEVGAKEMMKAAFAAQEGRQLYEAGKETEEQYHKPARQETERSEKRSFGRSRRQMIQN